ncbi:MAG: TatD family hydrolase [Bacteroidales bacterium]|nr:TatD family hydrolase [Bacteroidales bacterium]
MIDVHCHFDMMPNPEAYVRQKENAGDIVIGMTNLPSHFQMGQPYIMHYKHIRLGLGFHPLLAAENKNELPLFKRMVDETSYIGEIGLDFSREGYASKEEQIKVLKEILTTLRGKRKIVSVHSRRAEKELLELLEEYNIENVIFHWYSGSVSLIPAILERGYYFSINEAMTLSHSGKSIIEKIPQNRILMETDAPFNNRCSIRNAMRNMGVTELLIKRNFDELISRLK